MKYTDRVDGFQIVDPSYWPGFDPHVMPIQFDIVKWYQHDPIDAYDLMTREKKTVTESCYVVGVLEWDFKEPSMDLRSIGMRLLECDLTPAATEMIHQFVEKKSKELDSLNEELMKQRSWEGSSDYRVCPYCRKENSGLYYKFCPYCGRRVF